MNDALLSGFNVNNQCGITKYSGTRVASAYALFHGYEDQ